MNVVKIDREQVGQATKKPLYVLDWNIKTGMIQMSSNWMEVLGHEENSLPTTQWLNSVVHPDDLRLVILQLETRLSKLSDDISEFNFRMKNTKGQYTQYESLGMIVLTDLKGTPDHLIWASQDC